MKRVPIVHVTPLVAMIAFVAACDDEPVTETSAIAIETPAVTPSQCDATGRTVNIPIRMASTRGHVNADEVAVYSGRFFDRKWYRGKNHDRNTAGTCAKEDMRRHSASVTIPVNIKCVPYVQQVALGGQADPTKPCQAEIDFGTPVFPDGQTRFKESKFTGTYHLGTRWRRVDWGSPIMEKYEDYADRTSSCFYHEGSRYTGAQWCMSKSVPVNSVAPKGPIDIDNGTGHFVVGLGAAFIHSHKNPSEWNVVFGGGWSGLSYGPANVGVQWNVSEPDRDESTAWLGYNYTVQCGRDGKPYLISRDTVNAETGTAGLEYDWTPDQAKANNLCNDAIKKADAALPKMGTENDLIGELTFVRARARARDYPDCKVAIDLIDALLRNKLAREQVAAKREEVLRIPDNQHVIAALAELDGWLRKAEGLYAPAEGLKQHWAAVEQALANLDMIATLVGLQQLYPPGELPVFDDVVTSLLAYLRGPGPIDQARVTMDFAAVQARLEDVLRNRLCRTRAVAALRWDEIRWAEDLENKEPYVTSAREKITAAKTDVSVRTMTCDQVKVRLERLQSELSLVFKHLRGEKMVATMRALAQAKCINRETFQTACDALTTRLRGLTFADGASIDAAITALDADRKRLCDAPPVVIAPENDLPPIEYPTLPPAPPPPGDGELDGMLGADDIGDPEEADVALARMLGRDGWDPNGLALSMLGDEAPWFDSDWIAARDVAEHDELLEDATDPVEPFSDELTEQCDLEHDVYPWPYEGCAICAHCDGDMCAIKDGAQWECNASDLTATEPVSEPEPQPTPEPDLEPTPAPTPTPTETSLEPI